MRTAVRTFLASASLLLPILAAPAGCSSESSNGSSGAGATTLSLQGAYVPATGQSGTYRAIVFTDDLNYFLYLANCDAATDADQCRRAGTYTTSGSSVHLTDGTSGTTTTVPFSAITTAPAPEVSPESFSVHLDNLVTADGGAVVGDGGKLVSDGGSLFCSLGAIVHATQMLFGGTTMNRVGGSSDGANATLCDPSHAVQDCADQGAATTSGDAGGACNCTSRTGGATPACPVQSDAGQDAGAAARPSGGPGMQNGDGASSGGCSGKAIMFDYQGSCDFLHRCDSYSKGLADGQVEWGCLGHGDTCRDADFWISVPNHSLCGHSYKFCKGNACVTARALDVSNAGVYEASQGVLDALGIPYGGGESSCHGTYIGSSNGKITPSATLCND